MLRKSPQAINHWKTRGVPRSAYPDIVVALNISIETLVAAEEARNGVEEDAAEYGAGLDIRRLINAYTMLSLADQREIIRILESMAYKPGTKE